MSIFNKRSQEEIPPAPRPAAQPANRPAAPPPNPIEAKKEAPPLSTMPFKTPEPESTRGQASIGKAVKINGQIYSKEDLYVDGDVEGTIELQEHRLTIGPNGKVHSAVKAREVVILGNVQGNVDASDKLEIRKDARLVGDIKTARIIIEDGAYFKGSIDIVKPEQAKAGGGSTPPRPQQTTPAPVSNSQGAAAVAAEAKH
jgi:cytoskeletal protein CcmA (bactofilin family)